MRKIKPTTHPSKFANKRSAAQRGADLAEIAKLSLRGCTEVEIALELNKRNAYQLSRSTIHQDLAQLRNQWSESAGLDTAERFDEELARLGHIEKTAWRRFDDAGEPAWMNVVLRVISQRIQLLGLSRPVAMEFTGPNGGPIAVLQVPPRGVLDRDA